MMQHSWRALAATLAGLLAFGALIHSLGSLACLVVPLVFTTVCALTLRGSTQERVPWGWLLGWWLLWVALIWLVPVPTPEAASFRIDQLIVQVARRTFQLEWTQAGRLWSLIWAAGGLLLAGRMPTRFGYALALSLLPLLLVLFCLDSLSAPPFLFHPAVAEPRGGQFAFDGQLYLRTYGLMERGLGYYPAAAQAFSDDARRIPPQSFRPPLFYWLWLALQSPYSSWLCLLAALSLLTFGLVALEAGPGPALLAATLSLPLSCYVFLSANTLDFELWGGCLVLAGWLATLRGRPRIALMLVTLAVLGREMWILAWAATVVQLWRQNRSWRASLVSLAVIALYFGLHRWLSSPYLVGGAEGKLIGSFGHLPDPHSLWCCCIYGDLLSWPRNCWTAVLTLVGVFGLMRQARTGNAAPLLSVTLTAGLLLVFSHSPAGGFYPPDYWGQLLLPALMVGCGWAFRTAL